LQISNGQFEIPNFEEHFLGVAAILQILFEDRLRLFVTVFTMAQV